MNGEKEEAEEARKDWEKAFNLKDKTTDEMKDIASTYCSLGKYLKAAEVLNDIILQGIHDYDVLISFLNYLKKFKTSTKRTGKEISENKQKYYKSVGLAYQKISQNPITNNDVYVGEKIVKWMNENSENKILLNKEDSDAEKIARLFSSDTFSISINNDSEAENTSTEVSLASLIRKSNFFEGFLKELI